jgi:hypothetical protein
MRRYKSTKELIDFRFQVDVPKLVEGDADWSKFETMCYNAIKFIPAGKCGILLSLHSKERE